MSSLSDGDQDLPLHYWDIAAIGEALRSTSLSCVDLTTRLLERIDALNPHLNAYLLVMHDRALAIASECDRELARGLDRGPLHGVPIGVKDICHIAGFPTTGGMSFRTEEPSATTARAVEKLEQAGAVVLGKLNTTEGALLGYSRAFKIPLNPWDAAFWPGGSSSGSGVSVAAGLCFGAVGSDTGGSIRLPAMANGVVGLKPTYGRVSREGVIELAGSLDHIGPLARSARDATLLLQAMAEDDDDIVADDGPSIEGLTIGYDPDFTRLADDDDVVRAIEQALPALEKAGARVQKTTAPPLPENLVEIWVAVCVAETLAAHSETFPSKQDQYGRTFGEFLALGSMLTEEQVAAAREQRALIADAWTAFLSGMDAFVCPVAAPMKVTADQYGGFEEVTEMLSLMRGEFTLPADFAGFPTLTTPCGKVDGKPPLAVQVCAGRGQEQTLRRIGEVFEQSMDRRALIPIK